jgi:glycosyltransferase involved in cell wall biosynthesis
MKNVIVNAIPLRGQMNGIGRYVKSLFNELVGYSDLDIEFFYGTYFSKKLQNDVAINPSIIGSIKKIPFYYWLREFYMSSVIKSKTKKKKCIYHNPNFISYKMDASIVTNVHDISFIKYPKYHPKKRVEFLTKHIKQSIEVSDFIITDSNFIKEEIIEYFKIDSERIISIPLAAGNNFKKINDNECNLILSSYGLSYKKYFLSVSTLEPRKNIISAIRAYDKLPNKIQKEYPFVIVGAEGWLNSQFYNLINSLISKKKIILLGHIKEEDLPFLYSGAKLFIYPSIYEGFGLPILEAFASGVPVITSNRSSINEIAEKSALIVNPLNIDEIYNGFLNIIDNPSYEKELVDAGLLRAKKYTWNKTAQMTNMIYQKL